MGIDGSNKCDECENEAEYWLDSGAKFCCDCMIQTAENRKKELAELDGFDELDVVEVMQKEQVNRPTAIERLKERRSRGR